MFDKIFVIGTGGTGGYLIPPLVKTLNFHPSTKDGLIYIIDGDEFEERNLTRQMMTPSHVGQNKAEAMVEMCEAMGFNNTISVPEYIDTQGIIPYLNESERPLVIVAVDNAASRHAVITAIELECGEDKDFFFITPGNSDGLEEVRGQALWFGRINGNAFGMNPKLGYEEIRNPQDQIPTAGSCARLQESRPQLIAANFAAASHTLNVIQDLLDEKLDPSSSSIYFNVRNLKTSLT